MRFSTIDWIVMAILVIGGLNWGLIGLFDYNLVESIFGLDSIITRIIYVLVGLSALYTVFMAMRTSSN